MIKKVKGLVAVMAVLASVLVFAGCGKSTGSDGLPSNMGKEYVGETVDKKSFYEPQDIEITFNHDRAELAMKTNMVYDTSDSKKVTYDVIDKDELGESEKSNATKYSEKYQDKLEDKEVFYLKVKGLYVLKTSYWALGVSKDGKEIEMIPLSERLNPSDTHANLVD